MKKKKKKEVTGEDVCAREEETCGARVRKALQKHREFKGETPEWERARKSEKCNCEAEVFPFITAFTLKKEQARQKTFFRFISKVTIKSHPYICSQ